MIRVSIELLPQGMKLGREEIGLVEIANDGTGTAEYGNYNVVAFKRLGKYRGNRNSRAVWRKARVVGFERQRGPYALLKEALNQLAD